MCDKERLVSYLYEDLADAERAAFERHLRDCGDCREELNALRGVRADLISWSPPQPDFGFRVVREPKVLPMRPSWRAWWTPAAGLAAAAVLVLAAASALARVEVRSGPDGVTVRFGGAPPAAVSVRGDTVLPEPAASLDALTTRNVDASVIDALDRRLRALETLSREQGLVRNAAHGARASAADAEIIRRVREMLAQSETKQQGQLAVRLAQVIYDFDKQRVADLTRIQQGLRGIERTVTEEQQGHRELTNYLLASSKQK